MFRKILLGILAVTLVIAIVIKSSIPKAYYYEKGKRFYTVGDYQNSADCLEKSLILAPNDKNTRLYYAMALSKMKPTYSVQKKLYTIANSKNNDSATEFANTQINIIRNDLLKDLRDNYIDNAVSGNKVLRWDIKSFPLKVYYENKSSVPQYYVDNIEKAFNQWNKKTSFISFVPTDNKDDSDIYIKFADQNTNSCNSNNCTFSVAHTEPVYKTDAVIKRMNLTFFKTNPRNEQFNPSQIYNTALHEIGHTLGIMGHSDNPNDVMNASDENNRGQHFYQRSEFQYISGADLRTIALLYNLKPDISNKKNLSSEKFYYPPLILGSSNERLNKKVAEFEKYIKKYPKLASGYINLASVYADNENYDKALEILEYAQNNITCNKDEQYLIYYNQAIIYYNMHQYTKANEYIKSAQQIKETSETKNFINDLNEKIR